MQTTGAMRAEIRERAFRSSRESLFAASIPVFAEGRRQLARRRVRRWQAKRDLTDAPGHIKRKSREQF